MDLKANDMLVFEEAFQIRKSKSVFRIQIHQKIVDYFPSWQTSSWQKLTMPNDLNSQVEHCVYDPPLEPKPVVDSFILA